MTFCTAIKCVDGRTHTPVISFLTERFQCDYVDFVTEPGVNRIIAENLDDTAVASIVRRVDISVQKHQSRGIAISSHADCAGNPAPEDEQRTHTIAAVKYIRTQFPSVPVIGLWVDANWTVSELEID